MCVMCDVCQFQLIKAGEGEVVVKGLYAAASLVRNLAKLRQTFLDAGEPWLSPYAPCVTAPWAAMMLSYPVCVQLLGHRHR